MVLPTLTWNLVGPLTIVSGTAEAGGTIGSNTKQYLMYTIQQLVKASTYWLVDVQDVTGSSTEALVLKPNPSLSATPNMRVVLTMNVSGVLGGANPIGRIMQDRSAGTAAANTSGSLLIGFTPDNSPNPTWVTGSWNSDQPWGSSVRWSKYWGFYLSQTINSELMYLIETSETIWIGIMGREGVSKHFCGGAGAYIQSADSGSGEMNVGGVGRVFTMFVVNAGNNGLGPAATWLTNGIANVNQLGPFGSNTNISDATYTGVFIVSGGVPNNPGGGASTNTNYWENCGRAFGMSPSQPSDTAGDRGSNMTSGESLVGWPFPIVSSTAPIRMVGFLRQIYAVHDLPGLVTLATGTNNPTIIGYSWSPDRLNAGDAIILSNT